VLLTRGDALFASGDLSRSRLFYERAANAGNGQAAITLGETFDPGFLERARLSGASGDRNTALSWYRRARELGATEAKPLLPKFGNREGPVNVPSDGRYSTRFIG
jgi:TPR repeat protein